MPNVNELVIRHEPHLVPTDTLAEVHQGFSLGNIDADFNHGNSSYSLMLQDKGTPREFLERVNRFAIIANGVDVAVQIQDPLVDHFEIGTESKPIRSLPTELVPGEAQVVKVELPDLSFTRYYDGIGARVIIHSSRSETKPIADFVNSMVDSSDLNPDSITGLLNVLGQNAEFKIPAFVGPETV